MGDWSFFHQVERTHSLGQLQVGMSLFLSSQLFGYGQSGKSKAAVLTI